MKLTNNMKPKPWFYTPLFIGASLSLVFHITFLVAKFPAFSDTTPTEDAQAQPIEITQVPPEYLQPQTAPTPPQPSKPPTKSKRKVTETAMTEEAKNRDLDPNATLLGEHSQTVDEQTRAAAREKFRATEGTGLKGNDEKDQASLPPTDEGGKASAENTLEDGLASQPREKNAGVKRDWRTLSLQDLGVGGNGGLTGATDDFLEDVRKGDKTMLSTREFRYFAYFHRIKELLLQYWGANVRKQIQIVWARAGNSLGDEVVTDVLVLLDAKGAIHKVSRVASSGAREIDDAAVDAFHRAGPFPNPPKGMVDKDGFVRIPWSFILKIDSAPRIQFRNVGSSPH